MKTSKLAGVLSAIDCTKSDLASCQNRIAETEEGVSTTEDDVRSLQRRAKNLEEKVTTLTSKLDSYENRSRRSSLRRINLPESAEGNDACAFLGLWLPKPQDWRRSPLLWLSKLVGNGPPRPLFMKFLNYKDKVRVRNAARRTGKVLYKDRQVMLSPDVSAELHKQRRRFDGVKRKRGERPARLRVTYEGRSHFFDIGGRDLHHKDTERKMTARITSEHTPCPRVARRPADCRRRMSVRRPGSVSLYLTDD